MNEADIARRTADPLKAIHVAAVRLAVAELLNGCSELSVRIDKRRGPDGVFVVRVHMDRSKPGP